MIFVVLFFLFLEVRSYHNIDDFGAVSGNSTQGAASANCEALLSALNKANSSNDKVVLVPANKNYTFFYIYAERLIDVTLLIKGVLVISNDVKNSYWPRHNNDGGNFGALHFDLCVNLRVTGNGEGLINGNGYDWWMHVIETGDDYRPHCLVVNRTKDLIIDNLKFRNSPQFHILFADNMNVFVHDLDIYVDIEGQKDILRQFGKWDENGNVPTFPLNTDGVDPNGKNITIRNIKITNFDDAIAIKPGRGNGYFSSCSEDMHISNIQTKYSLGMAIGSVTPNPLINCIRNITFENVTMEDALKSVYVKSNPGNNGYGIIEDIFVKNLYSKHPLWYPIWIGPQQMKEPGKNGTGCSWFYPLEGECPTNPRITIKGIKLKNVTFEDTELIPGVILGDEKNPITDVIFEDVRQINGIYLVSKEYVSINVKDCYVKGNTFPIPDHFKKRD